MTQLAALLHQALQDTTFEASDGTSHSAQEFREALSEASGSATRTRELLSTPFTVGDVSPVVDNLRGRLSEYIDINTDRVGHSFRVIGDVSRRTTHAANLGEEINCDSSLEEFAESLTHAAAVVGSPRAAELIELWAGGKPLA